MSTLLRIEAIKDLIQEAVDRGATSVEQIHKIIADLPFTVLEQRGLLDEGGAALRDTNQRTIGSVYEAIRQINREIGDLATHLFEAVEDQTEVQRTIGTLEHADGEGTEAVDDRAGAGATPERLDDRR